MKTLALFAALTLTTFAADPAPPATKDPQQLLRDGLFEEEANRDLGKAAAAYADVLAQYDVQRQLAATALFRLAEIRAKQGKKDDAIALYQRLTAEFAAFEQIAKPARERLATLGAPAPAPGSDPGITQAEADELVKLREMAANSPDLLNAWRDKNDTPLSLAARNGWMKAAEFLIANGAQMSHTNRGSYPLRVAADAGHKRMVELLLDKGADMNAQDFDGTTPLMAACEKGRASVVRVFIERGADVNVAGKDNGRTALHAAVEGRDTHIVRLLLEKGAKPDVVWRRQENKGSPTQYTPLGWAASQSMKEMVVLLLEHKATADFGLADGVYQPLTAGVLIAVASKDSGILDMLLKRLEKVSDPAPLFTAVEQRDVATLKKLLALHKDVDGVNVIGETPLLAAASRAADLIPMLLDAGASAKAVDKNYGETALHRVANWMCRLDAQEGGAPVSNQGQILQPAIPRPGFSPIPTGQRTRVGGIAQPQPMVPQPPRPAGQSQQAPQPPDLKREQLQEIAKALLAKGADIHARLTAGQTLLHTVAGNGSLETFDWFVKQGADPLLKKEENDATPVDYAQGDRRIQLEARYVFPKLAGKDGVLVIARIEGINNNGWWREPFAIRKGGEFDLTPTLGETMSAAFADKPADQLKPNEGNGQSLWVDFEARVFRPGADGRMAELAKLQIWTTASAEEVSLKWPQLQWGDAVVFSRSSNGGGSNEISTFLRWLAPVQPHPRVTVEVGGRSQVVELSRVWSYQWAPLAEACPARNFSELVAHVARGEPAVDLSAVKVVRSIEGKPREWMVDLRAEKDAESLDPRVKRMPARLADGDRVVIPVKPTAESVAARRGGLWVAAHGRVFSERLLEPGRKGARPRRLSELMWAAQTGRLAMVEQDFSKVTIHRLKGDAGEEEHIAVDLAGPLALWRKERADVARKADVELQWGDVVEFGATHGVKPAEMDGIGGGDEKGEFLRDMLTRTVKVAIGEGPAQTMVLHAPIVPTLGVSVLNGIFEWRAKEAEEAFLPGTLVKGVLGNPKNEADYRKLVRVRITSGGVQRVLGREELEASKDWLRDGDEIVIETL